MNKDELIDAIVQLEWPMFAGVNNEGGKAACQMDLATFRIMRISQYSAWGEELLESCLADLRAAQNQGRNLMTEKYARMMKTTFPDEYGAGSKISPPGRPQPSGPDAGRQGRPAFRGNLYAGRTANLLAPYHFPVPLRHYETCRKGRKRGGGEPVESGPAVWLRESPPHTASIEVPLPATPARYVLGWRMCDLLSLFLWIGICFGSKRENGTPAKGILFRPFRDCSVPSLSISLHGYAIVH